MHLHLLQLLRQLLYACAHDLTAEEEAINGYEYVANANHNNNCIKACNEK